MYWCAHSGPFLEGDTLGRVSSDQCPAPYVVAAGHGADRLQALLNLCSTLIELGEVSEAIDFVVTEHTRRAGKSSD